MPEAQPNRAYAAREKAGQGTTDQVKALSEKDLTLARDQFKAIIEADGSIRKRLLSDHRYIDGADEDAQGNPIGKMWTPDERKNAGNRPTLEIDALSGPIAQVSNGLAEAKPAADMHPIGGGADVEKAEVWEGLLRRIQTTPEAEHAAAYASDHLVKIGRGAWVVTPRFPEFNGNVNDPANWEMELCREWIENQHAVFLGPAVKADGSDRMVAFILQPYAEDLFDARFGEGEFTKNRDAFEALSEDHRKGMAAWNTTKTVTAASWYRVKTKKVEISAVDGKGQNRTRAVHQRYVCHSIITATMEYEYEELPIPYIPIIVGEAKRSNVDGEKDVRGMVRRGRQPQDLVNVWNSYIAETIAKAARQEVIAAEGQIDESNADFWDMTKRLMYRIYKATSVEGKPVPPPQIVSVEPPIQAMTMALQQAESNVLKATLHYDAASDETNSERAKESGRARLMRQRQGELGASDFMRAYRFMILYEIKLLMAWIPHVYEAARVMRIVGRDEEEFTAVTHFGEQFAGDAQQLAQSLGGVGTDDGVKGIYDLSSTRYDVKASVQKNPLTQRQENVDILTETVPMLPPPQQAAILPIMFEEMEGTIMRKVAAALRPKEETVSVEDAKKAQMVMDEQSRIINELKSQIDAKDRDNASKQAIAQADNDTKVRIEELKFAHEFALKQLEYEFQMKTQARQAAIDASSRETEHAHSQEDAATAHERGIEASNHAAATEYALRDTTGEQGDGAGV
jgi:hypothetical protein